MTQLYIYQMDGLNLVGQLLYFYNSFLIRVLISPDYDQKELHPYDRKILQSIFGKENVYDFSGINEFTKDYHNYYESGHYRPSLGNKLLERIYKYQ